MREKYQSIYDDKTGIQGWGGNGKEAEVGRPPVN
jgi:hypothetical protein